MSKVVKKARSVLREEAKGNRPRRYPFKMDEMVELGLIKKVQMKKFMKMLASDDDEMNRLASTMLQVLAFKMHVKKRQHEKGEETQMEPEKVECQANILGI